MVWTNMFFELGLVIVHALISIPILSLLLRRIPSSKALQPTAGRSDD